MHEPRAIGCAESPTSAHGPPGGEARTTADRNTVDAVTGARGKLAKRRQARRSLLTIQVFHSHARPGVAHMLRTNQPSSPVPRRQKPQAVWTLNLHPHELEQLSKAGGLNETLPLAGVAGWEWLARALTLMVDSGASNALGRHAETLADRPLADWTAAFLRVAKQLGVPLGSQSVLYRLRHAGVSHDVALQPRKLAKIRKREWRRSDSSVTRCAKPARPNQQLLALVEQRLAREQMLAAACPTTLLRAPSENSCDEGCRSFALVQADHSTPESSSTSSQGRSG